MANNNFKKFADKGLSGARKKEMIRQEKKKLREEKNAYFESRKTSGGKPADAGSKPSAGNRSPKAAAAPARPGAPSARPIVKKGNKPSRPVAGPAPAKIPAKSKAEPMPLNKFIAHAGLCSRRDAAQMVKEGQVLVDGKPILEPGFKVNGTEEVKVNGKKISIRKQMVYILLNKPKDHITTMEDPGGRKTVYDIIRHATQERVYPVGRLDRNTTGVLLFTNDGDLAQKLSHPSYEIRKIYEVRLDKALPKKDMETLAKGITLEDGFIAPDSIAYADAKDKSVVGIEIHSGRNRIVRRMFEHLGYDVRNLDRVMFANLTKKNVDRGKWRFLNEKEVRLLKFLNASYARQKN